MLGLRFLKVKRSGGEANEDNYNRRLVQSFESQLTSRALPGFAGSMVGWSGMFDSARLCDNLVQRIIRGYGSVVGLLKQLLRKGGGSM